MVRNTFGRIGITFGFAAVIFAAGFIMATGWELPTRLTAEHPSLQPAAMPQQSVPLVDESGNSPFVAVAEAVQPVVVNITAEKTLGGRTRVPFDIFDWGPFFGEPPRNQQRQPHITTGGSGVIIDTKGHILTNNHVISEAEEIKVKLADGSEHTAEIIGRDPETDVALIKIDGPIKPEMIARLGDSDKIRIGEWAIAVGNPFGLDWTVTVGVISARGRSNLRLGGGSDQAPSYQDFIQTDASINFGNSGGPLVNIRGEVIGLNTAINAQGQGIGFAIPINMASKVIEQLKEKGEVRRGYLGIYPAELDELNREALGIPNDVEGVFVQSVQPNTPAEKGGLAGGEVITEIEGKPVKDVKDFRFLVADFPPNSAIEMTIWRNSKLKKLKFKLGDRSEYLSQASTPTQKPEEFWLGIQIAAINSPEGRRLGAANFKGVVVVGVEGGSPAEGLLEAGDVITEIGGITIESLEDYRAASEKLKDRKKAIPFWIFRDGMRTFIPIRPDK